jgi:AraC-like DNA-binding protein
MVMKGELCGGLGKVVSAGMSEHAVYFRPAGLAGVEALHARFVEHAYMPHSHPTWTVAVVQHGAARFEVDATRQRADRGELFVLEPEAVHTGMAAVPEGWAYKVLYLDPALLHEWDELDSPAPRAARWVVFRDRALRDRLLRTHAIIGAGPGGLELEESVLAAVDALRPHLRPGPPAVRGRAEHAAVRRARAYLVEHWDQPVPLATLSTFAGLTRFELVRRFRDQTGLTPHAFQTNLRIARARALLRSGEPIARVAAACGFADQPHLTRTFRRATGVTPGRFVAAA